MEGGEWDRYEIDIKEMTFLAYISKNQIGYDGPSLMAPSQMFSESLFYMILFGWGTNWEDDLRHRQDHIFSLENLI